ncbi:MAG: hypothetical protein CL920_32185 [Deltaproteobacteria bacterium]|nr:hypothetical protein [Deltaproteobacteria bacterium]MBU53379.1 hypothetical protein [Deltaproteobacteria bacterium]|tara:strand:- start:1695 stop:2354 length:660 start_codon:yes stop_codon:yes gene_type:complete
MSTTPKLSIEDLSISLGGTVILERVECDITSGVLGIYGPNGSGKSTLMRTIAGIYLPRSGRIQIAGHDLEQAPVLARQQLGYVPEHADLYPYITCRELCDTVGALRGDHSGGWKEQLAAVGLQGKEDMKLGTLSAGQQRKVTLLVALCGSPQVLLLDEPTKALDQQSLGFLNEIIQDWKDQQKLILLTSHLRTYLETYCAEYLILSNKHATLSDTLPPV